jgi:prepilin-type N-terminal cleavage/methylation domain-containing protein
MKKNRGFTLIEILIVISIGSVVMTIAAARYNQLTQRKRIEQQTKNTVTFLRKIKKMADSGEKPGCASGTILEQYNVWNDAANPEILKSLPICGGSQGSEVLLDNLSGTKVQAERSFEFLPLSKGANVDDSATAAVENEVVIEISNSNNSINREVVVDSGGNINDR